ncbi:MAG: hypothetical protein VX764_06855 [Planctomycetota bacterium]|nr:hypothetical protein [Planctomycetota bacterium]
MTRSTRARCLRWIGCWLLLWAAGCVSIERQADRYQQLQSQRYVIVHPEGRETAPEYIEFARWKSQQGYAIEWIPFSPDASPEQRFRSVSQQLKERRPATGESAFLLIAATHEELPMGPWQPSGTDLTIHSDLPLLAGREDLGGRLEPSDWQPAIAFPPTWISGRIPYEDPEVVAAALKSARIFQEKQGPRSALLGSERFAVVSDAALVMAGVRNDLQALDWNTHLFNEDWPRDLELDEKSADVTITSKNGRRKMVTKFRIEWGFISCWKSNSPDIVYVISHSSGFTENGIQSVGAGEQLFAPRAFQLWNDPNFNTSTEQGSPATPAIFLTTGCTMGTPENPMLELMAGKGWAAAIITGTHNTAPLPLFAAIRAERSAPLYFAEGLTVGQSHHATLNAYLQDSRWDPGNWLLYPWARKAKLQNVLGLTIYGDPSISMGERTSADDSLTVMHQQ